MNSEARSRLKITPDLPKVLKKKPSTESSQTSYSTKQEFDIKLSKLHDELTATKKLILIIALSTIPFLLFTALLSSHFDAGLRDDFNKVRDDLVPILKKYSEKTKRLRETEKVNAEIRALIKECKASLKDIKDLINTYKDCHDYYIHGFTSPGVYTIFPNNMTSCEVWCDFGTSRGWTVIQRRIDGSLDFNRGWSDYRNGFGEAKGEYWIGNELIHMLTRQNKRLNIGLQFNGGGRASGTWSNFIVEDESTDYRLNLGSDKYSGTLEKENFEYHNKQKFTTFDHDNDGSRLNCADGEKGGWWFKDCTFVNLNGAYGRTYAGQESEWTDGYKETTMKVTRN